tara:strand:- start:94 stop:552 length:459 start_codon:yes stop_codon:yes gene_type:complete
MGETINLKEFYLTDNENIRISAQLFRKLEDYTDLLTHIIEVNNRCLLYRQNNNLPMFFCIYIDLKNVKLKNADYEFIKMLIPFLENAYPDNLEKMYFMNTPFIFKTAYSIIRAFIHKDTRKKITFIKSKDLKNLNKEFLDEEVPEDKLDDLF